MTDPAFDIESLHKAYVSGLSALEMIDIVFRRIAEADDPGIFIHLADVDALMKEARGLGPFDLVAKPLWGIPFAVKDNIDVAGMPTTAACPDFAYKPDEDATVVSLLKAAGAIVIGKTNLDQFATGLVGVRTPYPIPRNAVDPTLAPGGSSSGSAVSVARGIVSFALGTDTAGSGRVPAGLNNIVGLKPTVGALSTTGVVPACRTLDCVSILALTVADAYSVLSVAARPDPKDAYSRPVRIASLAPRPPVLKVGVPARRDRKFFDDHAMEAAFDASLSILESLGCKIEEIPFADFYATADLLYEGAWVAERYAAIQDFFDHHEDALHPITRKIIGGARNLSAADAFRGLYMLQSYRAKLAPMIASVDLICVPTTPTHYTVEQVLADPIITNSRLGAYTNFVNLLDLCGIALPSGLREDGLPMSVTLLAPAGRDGQLASLGREIHRRSPTALGATRWAHDSAPLDKSFAGSKEDGKIELAVVGAHLSGMPLNGELKDAGAQFCRVANTAHTYRLFALDDHAVPKPGLLRTNEGEGGSIEVEIWRLDPAAFGRFVAAIPAPLGIGAVELADGSRCKGFVVEAAGLRSAIDISSYGGWRNYLERNKQPEPQASSPVK